MATAGVGLAVGAAPAPAWRNTRELFVDDHLLESVSGLEARLGQVTNAGPVLALDRPWEGPFAGAYATVLQTPAGYQMYYRGAWGEGERNNLTCCAESADGLTWTRPDLGLFEVAGTRHNNVVLPPGEPHLATHNFSVDYDARPGVPADERYKAVGGGGGTPEELRAAGVAHALYRFASADGKHWRLFSPAPLFTGYTLDSLNVLTWVPAERQFAIYLRVWSGDKPGQPPAYQGVRSIARATARDFGGAWSEPERMTFGDTPPEDLYTNATRPYFRAPQLLIALPFRFVPDRVVLAEAAMDRLAVDPTLRKGVSDAVLMTSRGENVYQRKFLESFLRPGLDASNWAARSNMPAAGVVPTGPAEMSFDALRGYATKARRIERFTLRTDGFASLHAGYGEGSAVTRPMRLEGGRLSLNLSTSARGSARVAILDAQGREVPGFGEAEAIELVGDGIDLTPRWRGGASVASISGRVVKLKFILRDADLYAIGVFDR